VSQIIDVNQRLQEVPLFLHLGCPDENGLRIIEQTRAANNREHGIRPFEELGEVSLVLDITYDRKKDESTPRQTV